MNETSAVHAHPRGARKIFAIIATGILAVSALSLAPAREAEASSYLCTEGDRAGNRDGHRLAFVLERLACFGQEGSSMVVYGDGLLHLLAVILPLRRAWFEFGPKGSLTALQLQEALALHRQGWSLMRLGQKFGVDPKTMKKRVASAL